MSMEKRGVTEDDSLVTETVVAGGITRKDMQEATKAAQDKGHQCCGGSCGSDPLSKLADAVKDQSKK